jgi:type VI secretion system secreted protein VgrG
MADNPEFFKLTIEGLSSELHVIRFRGREGISELFDFEVEFVSDDAAIDFEAVVGKPALLEMRTDDDPRYVHGIVSRFEETAVGRKFTNYTARIVPALWTFGLKNDCCIFQGLNVPDVIKDVLQSGGLESGTDFDIRVKASYPAREYCVQYRETDLDFVTRLMEEAGIFYFFEHSEDGHVLVLGDDSGAHADIGGPVVLPYRAVDTGLQAGTDEVTGVRFTRTLRTGTVAMRSYNFEKSKLKLETASKADVETAHEHYDYDGRYHDDAAGKALVKVRQEAFAARRRTLSGSSNCRHLTAGFKFGISEHPRDEFNADYVLTRVSHAGEQPQAAGEDAGDEAFEKKAYSNTFEAIPAAVVFRPLQLTERALVDGPQTAIVTGEAGEEIHCDAHGRVKVQFHWDRLGKADDKSSCWVRVCQSNRGSDVAIPRVGWEVIVSFLEGDPDQPLITGRVYNGTNQAPYALPGDKTKSSIKTLTSPGGGGYNELRFEDASGSEEVYLHSQKDWNIVVLNDRTQTVGHDSTDTIDHDQTLEVKHDRFRKVGHHEAVEIAADQLIKVGADRTESVGGNESVKIDKNRTHEVLGNDTETIGKERKVSVGAKDTLTVGDAHEISVGGDQSFSVKGNQSQTVKGDASIEVKGNADTTVKGDASDDVKGDSNLKVGKALSIKVKDEFTLKCGDASITLKKNGDIEIKGGKISIKADKDMILKGSKIAEN